MFRVGYCKLWDFEFLTYRKIKEEELKYHPQYDGRFRSRIPSSNVTLKTETPSWMRRRKWNSLSGGVSGVISPFLSLTRINSGGYKATLAFVERTRVLIEFWGKMRRGWDWRANYIFVLSR